MQTAMSSSLTGEVHLIAPVGGGALNRRAALLWPWHGSKSFSLKPKPHLSPRFPQPKSGDDKMWCFTAQLLLRAEGRSCQAGALTSLMSAIIWRKTPFFLSRCLCATPQWMWRWMCECDVKCSLYLMSLRKTRSASIMRCSKVLGQTNRIINIAVYYLMKFLAVAVWNFPDVNSGVTFGFLRTVQHHMMDKNQYSNFFFLPKFQPVWL